MMHQWLSRVQKSSINNEGLKIADEWTAFDSGSSIGEKGSESGTIILDEENSLGARITLEENARDIPYAITCGIYGLMIHTTYFSNLTEAKRSFELMKADLETIFRLPSDDMGEVLNQVRQFVDRY